ncbi:2,6-beta-D-fructofuranosidase, partial [bacterium]|nr:2,6-beta-D-fructofuranosidase [bacterium]
IQRRYINFLIGGGMHPGTTCINLLMDGEVKHTATGPNDRPGGSERLAWHSWDVKEFAGERATIQIVDQAQGGWGHINIDQIVQSDEKREAGPQTREIAITKRYLHLPVNKNNPKRRMKYLLDGNTAREFSIKYAPANPAFWVFSDMREFQGETITVHIESLPAEAKGLALIRHANQVPNAETMYTEKYRPQFHFSSRRGWNNDPNGLVYYDGEYHLYYQHNPYGWSWGNMHWGHAVSRDLLHWEELPIALYPQEYGDWCFSGSAVIDEKNTAGFKTGPEDVLVAAYTSTGRGECIAYSNDRGRTFKEYEGNPVVKHRGRDPKVIWYEPGNHWVMAVYDEIDKSRGIAFYTSPDLKHWERESRIEGYYECPEIFSLPVDGDAGNTKWVVYAADGGYALGSFDGKTFTAETEKMPFNYGNCFYASQIYNNIPKKDGRRIQIAWGRTGHPDMPFNQMMDFPVELTLHSTQKGIRMFAQPVRELSTLRQNPQTVANHTLKPSRALSFDVEGNCFEIITKIELGEARQVGINVCGIPITYDVEKQKLQCQKKTAPLQANDGKIQLHLLVDRLSIEIFANQGRIYMPMGMTIPQDSDRLHLFAKGGQAEVVDVKVNALKSIWD